MLKSTFISLIANYTKNDILINELWIDIEKKYSTKKKYYHTLVHLENILKELLKVKGEIKNWNVVLFSLYYHDIIYNSSKSDNEEKSAEYAERQMKKLLVEVNLIEGCKRQILATKTHSLSAENDINYFIDADLSVLGERWEIYKEYFINVRKEYSIYPKIIYNSGRKKVLVHFLESKKIFKTDFFYNKYEVQAKQNLQKEIELL